MSKIKKNILIHSIKEWIRIIKLNNKTNKKDMNGKKSTEKSWHSIMGSLERKCLLLQNFPTTFGLQSNGSSYLHEEDDDQQQLFEFYDTSFTGMNRTLNLLQFEFLSEKLIQKMVCFELQELSFLLSEITSSKIQEIEDSTNRYLAMKYTVLCFINYTLRNKKLEKEKFTNLKRHEKLVSLAKNDFSETLCSHENQDEKKYQFNKRLYLLKNLREFLMPLDLENDSVEQIEFQRMIGLYLKLVSDVVKETNRETNGEINTEANCSFYFRNEEAFQIKNCFTESEKQDKEKEISLLDHFGIFSKVEHLILELNSKLDKKINKKS